MLLLVLTTYRINSMNSTFHREICQGERHKSFRQQFFKISLDNTSIYNKLKQGLH